MEQRQQLNRELDFANYYAVEILSTVFGKVDPAQFEIDRLEKEIQQEALNIVKEKNPVNMMQPSALIISSDPVEQNALSLMLHAKNFAIDFICNKFEFIKLATAKLNYDLVIVSDKFKEIGINFFPTYFSLLPGSKARMIYLGETNTLDFKLIGFNAVLSHPFMVENFSTTLQSILEN